MYAMTEKYEDFMGKEREETFYFNLTKAEVADWLTTDGDYTLDKLLLKLTQESNGKELTKIFKELLERSYGKPSLDGRRFMKNDDIWKDFCETIAYSNIYMKLASSGEEAAKFVNGILPKEYRDEIGTIVRENPQGIPDDLREYASVFAANS